MPQKPKPQKTKRLLIHKVEETEWLMACDYVNENVPLADLAHDKCTVYLKYAYDVVRLLERFLPHAYGYKLHTHDGTPTVLFPDAAIRTVVDRVWGTLDDVNKDAMYRYTGRIKNEKYKLPAGWKQWPTRASYCWVVWYNYYGQPTETRGAVFHKANQEGLLCSQRPESDIRWTLPFYPSHVYVRREDCEKRCDEINASLGFI